MKHYIRNSLNTGLGFALAGAISGPFLAALSVGNEPWFASAFMAFVGFACGLIAYTLFRSIRWIYSA